MGPKFSRLSKEKQVLILESEILDIKKESLYKAETYQTRHILACQAYIASILYN